MTLQRFIVSYVFQPLSLPFNRLAARRKLKGWPAFFIGVAIPTFVSFLLIGIWHGAGWTFVWFGVMHACYICANEAWRQHRKDTNRRLRRQGLKAREPGFGEIAAYHVLTLAAVVFANVLFRADTLAAAFRLWSAMVGASGVLAAPALMTYHPWGLALVCLLGALIIAFLPNTQQIMRLYRPAYDWSRWRDVAPALLGWTWRPSLPGLLFAGVVLFFGIEFIQRGQAVFLYFNF